MDGGLLGCNLALFLKASVLPFPTAELAFAMGREGTRGDKLSALLLYAVISAAMAGSWLIMFVYLNRHPGLLRPGVTAGFFRTERLRAVVGISAAFVPVLVGLLNPAVGLGFIVAMPVFYATAGGLKSRRVRVAKVRAAPGDGARRGSARQRCPAGAGLSGTAGP